MNDTQAPVWLVTGAAGTLGQALVEQLIADGVECIALDRNERALNQLHDRLQAKGARPPLLVPMDLVGAGPEEHAQVAEAIQAAYGKLDVLIHAAALFNALRPLEHQPMDEWMKILHTSLTGPLLLTQALLPLLRQSDQATIAMVSNHYCLEKPAHWGAYGMSQAARAWLCRALAEELGPRGPRVLDLDPGPFFSPMRTAAWPVDSAEDLPSAQQAAQSLLSSLQKGD